MNPNDLRRNAVQRVEPTGLWIVQDSSIKVPIPPGFTRADVDGLKQVVNHLLRTFERGNIPLMVELPSAAPARDREVFVDRVNKMRGAMFGRVGMYDDE